MSGTKRAWAFRAIAACIAIACFLTCAFADQDDQKPLVATLLSLHEFRNHSYLASRPLHFEPETSLSMNLSGEGLRDAVGYSDAHVTEAIDDEGHSLVENSNDPTEANLSRIGRSRLYVIDRVAHPYPQPVFCSINLNLAPRSAKKLVKLRGMIQICTAGTGEQIVRISHARKWIGKDQINDAALGKAGTTLTLYRGDKPEQMSVKVTGELFRVRSFEAVDVSTHRVVARQTRVVSEPDRFYEMEFVDKEAQGNDFDLVCHLATGQKTNTLPFELKNCPVKLP